MISIELARQIIASAPGVPYVDYQGAPVIPQEGQRFCAFYVTDPADHGFDGEASVNDGSIVEYVGEGRVINDNCADEDKSDYVPGGEFCDFLVRQS